MKMAALLVLTTLLAVAAVAAPAGKTFYVGPRGSDANPGTKAKPFATLARAQEAVRGAGRTSPVAVEVAAGSYELAAPLEFTAADSGTPQAPVEYRAAAGEQVRLLGGRVVPGLKPVTAAAVLQRLAPTARGKVLQADLKALGLTDLEGINHAGTYQSDPGLEVFFTVGQGCPQPLTLARYPNEGYLHIKSALDAEGNPKAASTIVSSPQGRFVCDDPRPARWAGEKGIWLHGFWTYDWADLRVPLASIDPATNTLALGPAAGTEFRLRTGQWFYAQNVLPELDSPGEWYLDRDTATLYLWPPAASGTVTVSVVRDLFRLTDASHLTFRGFTVECGRGSAFLIKGGENVRVVACTLRNLGNWGVKVYGGLHHGVVGCDIYQTGQGGAHLEGGDRKTLTPAGHYADNNHIHHTARWDPVYQQAITVFGVGNSATHNLIDNVPHIAIGFTGNEQTIEYNEIHSAVFQSNDAGAIYTSPPDETWTMRGHKIRYNYLHNIHGFLSRGCMGVYLDDCFSSADISGNIFYDVATGILIGGGRDNLMQNNLFVNCRQAFSIDARGLGWAKGVGEFATRELIGFNYQQPPWSLKYPELLNLLEDEPLAPKGNVVRGNVIWGGKFGSVEGKAAPYLTNESNLLDTDPRFVKAPPLSFRLSKDSPARALGFHNLPFERMGLYESSDRASWPVTSTLRVDPPPPAPKPAPVRTGGAPSFTIPRRVAAVTIDGTLGAEEWFGLDPGKGLVLQEDVDGAKVPLPTKAWLSWDEDALYVAFDNAVSKAEKMGMEEAWGGNDAVELSISNPAAGAKAPILVLRGFACGVLQSSEEAGASPEAARRAGQGVQYAARVVEPGRWVAELRIPLASLGLKPQEGLKYPFNLAVRKQGDVPWVLWRGTSNCTWYLPNAGFVRFGS